MIRLLLSASIVAFASAAATPQLELEENLSRWKANMSRHQQVVMQGVPVPYDRMRDPEPDSLGKLRRGTLLFDRHCSSCHGWAGTGGGSEGFFLVPAPADLQWLARTPKDRSDPYIYWTVAEGGKAFESEMPAFKESLTDEDIWSLTAYLRAGMPYASP
jgi:mono/diheme cytochrome c family protein